MSMQNTQTTTQTMMTKQEAEEKNAQIIELSGGYVDKVGPIALEMRDREGWRALGFKNWTDYCHHVDERISAVNVMRLAQKAEVEQNVQAHLPMRHALQLARLPAPEVQREVFAKVQDAYDKPIEQNYQTYVEGWFRDNEPDAPTEKISGRRRGKNETGWTRSDLNADEDLSEALDRIEKVYGQADRKAIQDGTIGLSRKDAIALAAFHASKMKEVQHLIMANHWDVETSMKFINKTLGQRDTIGDLINHCIGTVGLYYTCSVDGYDIQIKANAAVGTKISRSSPKITSCGQALLTSKSMVSLPSELRKAKDNKEKRRTKR